MTELSIISGKSGRAAPRSLSTNKRSMQVMLNLELVFHIAGNSLDLFSI